MYWRVVIVAMLLWPSSVLAVELRHNKVKTGLAGLTPAPVSVANTGTVPITCTAQLAHWYSAEMGTAAPGAALRMALWLEPATGTYVILNGAQENMPVESLWCGIAGRAYETRAAIVPGNAAMACAKSGERLACE